MRSPYTEYVASGLPNPTPLEGEVRFVQAQDQQVVTTRSPRIITECLLTRSMHFIETKNNVLKILEHLLLLFGCLLFFFVVVVVVVVFLLFFFLGGGEGRFCVFVCLFCFVFCHKNYSTRLQGH